MGRKRNMGTKTKSPSKSRSWTVKHTVIVCWIITLIWAIYKKPQLLKEFFSLFINCPLQTTWNTFLIYIASYAIIKVWVLPFWRFIFADTQKLGQKIEWYNEDFKHLTPDTKELFIQRWSIILALSLCSFFLSLLPINIIQKYSLSYSSPYQWPKDAALIFSLTQLTSWSLTKYFSLATIYFWIISLLEGRSRVIARILTKYDLYKDSKAWEVPLPEVPWSKSSPKLELCFFSQFVTKTGESATLETSYEKWIQRKEAGLVTNTLGIAPTGGGKTSSLIKPTIEQAILWQNDRSDLKASVAVYDPKGELTDYAVQIAKKADRENDLCVLSLKSLNNINPLQVNNIWDGQTSWRISGWVISAWLNFQGKSSPEPYWENQNYLLVRNLLVLLYLDKGNNVGMYDISKMLGPSSTGCFIKQDKIKTLTEFGTWVFKAYIMALSEHSDEEAIFDILDEYELNPIKLSQMTPEIFKDSEERLVRRKKSYEEYRKKYHINTNIELKKIMELGESAKGQQDLFRCRNDYLNKLKELVTHDMNEKFKDKKMEPQDFAKTHLIQSTQELKSKLEADLNDEIQRETAYQIIKDACEWLIKTWSQMPPENRANIVSNMEPFLKMFETPEVRRSLSPANPQINFDQIITEGSIVIPSFPGIEIGDSLADAIVTLIKARWQYAVLSNSQSKRVKFQIVDEAQRVITFGEGRNAGDFEYLELSRSFGGITLMTTQSISALRAKAPREADWEKIHGVIRSIICFATNDSKTIRFIQDIAGKTVKERVSKTVLEGANSPELDMISEKYKGDSSLSVSFTTSQSLEDYIQSSDIQGAKAFTGIAILFDGLKSEIMKVAFKPTFWPDRRDKWAFMDKLLFQSENRNHQKYPVRPNSIETLFPNMEHKEV
jgi:hypothetical protein